jgi:DNA-binding ferritin-like protein (Dps family)
MKISILVSKKDTLIDTIKDVMSRYLLNKMYGLYEDCNENNYDFQKKLYEIPSWSEKKFDKEFYRFLKYVYKKKKIDEAELNAMLGDIIFLNIKILTKSPIEINAPDIKTFWYKLVKLTGKYFYNKVKDRLLIDREADLLFIENLIELLFQKYIPLNDIINDNTEIEKVNYNFGETGDSETGVSETGVGETGDNIDLKYISPEHFYFKTNEPISVIDNSQVKEINVKTKLNLL